MAELRRRKADEESNLDENVEQPKSDQVGSGGAGTDDDSKQSPHQQQQQQQKRKTSSGLNTADSSDHVNFILRFLIQIGMCMKMAILVCLVERRPC